MGNRNLRMLLVSEIDLKNAIKQHMVTVGDEVFYEDDEDWDLAFEDMIEDVLSKDTDEGDNG